MLLDVCTNAIEAILLHKHVIANGNEGVVVAVELNDEYPIKVHMYWMELDGEPWEYAFNQVNFNKR